MSTTATLASSSSSSSSSRWAATVRYLDGSAGNKLHDLTMHQSCRGASNTQQITQLLQLNYTTQRNHITQMAQLLQMNYITQ